MLPGMICEHVCNSLANSDDITKLAAIILTQATLNFQKVYDSCGNNNSFYETDENSLCFKGNSWESLDENDKKEATTTKGQLWEVMVLLAFTADCLENACKTQTKTTRRGPPGSTIIILLVIITNNNNNNNNNNNHLIHGPPRFLPIRSSSWRGLPPPLRGGNAWCTERPVHPIPSYPALSREDTTFWNDGRPRTHHEPESNHSRAQFGKWPQEALNEWGIKRKGRQAEQEQDPKDRRNKQTESQRPRWLHIWPHWAYDGQLLFM